MGTSPERIAAESVTRTLFESFTAISRGISVFHHKMQWCVAGGSGGRRAHSLTADSGRDQCDLPLLALAGWGSETNWVACTMPIPSGVGIDIR